MVLVLRLRLQLVLVVVWDRHGGGHRGRRECRVESLVVVVVVDLEMERVVDRDWPRDRMMDRLWNRDGSSLDGRAVELHNPKIRHSTHEE